MHRRSLRLAAAMTLTILAALAPDASGRGLAGTVTPTDAGCRFITAIPRGNVGAGSAALADTAAPGSAAEAYAAFSEDLRVASSQAGRNTEREVTCGRRAVKVRLLRYVLPIKLPKAVTTVYRRFRLDPEGRVASFAVNGDSIRDRAVVGSSPPATALGTTVSFSSAYRVPPGGGESIVAKGVLLVAVRATASPDGTRNLETGASSYRVAGRTHAPPRITVGQGSPLQPGGEVVYVLEFPDEPFGGTLTLPVTAGAAAQPADQIPLEAAVVTVG